MNRSLFKGHLTRRNWRNFWQKITPLFALGLVLLCLTGKTALAVEAGLVFLVASFNFFLSAQITDFAPEFSAFWAAAALLFSFVLRLTLAAVFLVAAFMAGLNPYVVAIVYLATHLLLSTMTAADFYLNFAEFSKEGKTT